MKTFIFHIVYHLVQQQQLLKKSYLNLKKHRLGMYASSVYFIDTQVLNWWIAAFFMPQTWSENKLLHLQSSV